MIPKRDENPPISLSAPPRTPSPPQAQKRSPFRSEKKALRRNSKSPKRGSKCPSPPNRRNSIESCSSINSTAVIPAAITTSAPPLSPLSLASPSTRVSPPRNTAKGVSFNKRVRIRKIKRLEDMSEEEIKATYFTDKELMDIRNDLRSKIRSMVQQNHREHQPETVDDYDDDSTNFCVRGLEHEFPQGKFRRKQLKMMSRGAVLEEQRLQRQFRVGRYGKGHNSLSNHSTSTDGTLSTCDSSINSFHHVVDEDADHAISAIYRIESKPAVQLALEYGKGDEAIADQIYFAHQCI